MVRLTLAVPIAATLLAGCGSSPTAPTTELPLTFVENRGQTDPRVRFHAQGPGHAFFLTPDRIALTLQRDSGKGVALALRFLGANDVVPAAGRQAPGTFNYLNGDKSHTNVPGYAEITYPELWPGIDMRLRGQDGQLKYEFVVRPGARPQDIRLGYDGAEGLRVGGDGSLLVDTALGELRDAPPVAFQDGAQVPAAFSPSGSEYGFTVGAYDPARELIIDPGLAYSTFLGGTSHEMGAGIAVDAAGNAYVTGFTQSPNFPTTSGAFDRSGAASNNLDVFVSKLNPTGTALVYSTFIGGTNFDWGRDIEVDAAGNAYVTGQTRSSNFPTTGGAFDRSFNVDNCPRCGIDQYDAFIAKLNPAGSSLVYSTFLGGTDLDDSLGIAIDGARNAYVTGQTVSSNFPTTSGAFDRTANGGFDAFVTKLNAAGSALVYSTRLGGEDNELPEDVEVDGTGSAFVGGSTRSAGFPTTTGPPHRGGAFDERFDVFASRLNPAGSALAFSTLAGGSHNDFASDFATDAAGNGYLVGSSQSTDFPSPGFALKLGSYARALDAFPAAVAPDADGNAWLAGSRGGDVYAARLSADGATLEHETVFGGSETESAADVAVGSGVHLTGHTYSADFPTTPGAVDRVWGGDTMIFWGDAFVAKLDLEGTLPPVPTPAPAPSLVSPDDGAVAGQPVTFDWSDVAGATAYTIQVDEISEFGAPLILSANTSASQFTTSALPDGNWFWRVRAEGGAWSSVRRITVQSAPPPPPPPEPGAPSLVSPLADAQVAQPFTFDWSDVDGAAWYVIEVDNGSSLVWAATTTPSELSTNSLPNGTLFWRVRAFNENGVGGPYSEKRTVRVATPLAAPTLVSPSYDARFRPGQAITFDWSNVTNATSYTIEIDDSQSFSAPLTASQTVAGSQFTTSTLPTRRMWWRVRANDGGAWSSSRRFEVRN